MNEWHSGKNPVTFPSEDEILKGNLFLPPNFDPAQQYPAVIVAGSWTTVKEQMAGLYAERLAAQGFVTLAFDFRHYGESGGEPRNYEVPEDKIEDIRSAISYVQSLPFVHSQQIGGLGVCFSTGLMAAASVRDPRLNSVAMIAPWLHNRAILDVAYGGPSEIQRRLNAADAAKSKFDVSGEVETMVGASFTDPNAAMIVDNDYYLNPQRGGVPEWPNQVAVMTWRPWAEFDGVAIGSQLRVPVLLVHSEKAAIPDGAKAFYTKVPDDIVKDFLWLDGTQWDFYDQEPQVNKSVEAVRDHFQRTL
jgi:uncharacterized protein